MKYAGSSENAAKRYGYSVAIAIPRETSRAGLGWAGSSQNGPGFVKPSPDPPPLPIRLMRLHNLDSFATF